jgi:hypothetical protein
MHSETAPITEGPVAATRVLIMHGQYSSEVTMAKSTTRVLERHLGEKDVIDCLNNLTVTDTGKGSMNTATAGAKLHYTDKFNNFVLQLVTRR